MSEWKSVNLSDIADVFPSNVDKLISSKELPVVLCNYMDVYSNRFIRKSIPFSVGSVRPSEFKRFRLRPGDVMVTKDSETPDDIGIPSVVVDEIDNMVCGYHLAIIRVDQTKNNGMFLMYALQAEKPVRYFSVMSNGITRYGLTIGALQKQQVFIPNNVTEQSKIAEILFTVDETIDKTRALIVKYQNVKTGIMQDLLRSIDTDENRVKLSTCALLLNGDRGANYPTAEDIVTEGSAFINAGHLENGKVNWQVCDYITHKKYMSLRGAKIQLGDIIYCLRGTLGKNAYVDKDNEGTVASSLVVIRPQSINSLFLYYQLNSFIEEKQRLASDNGTAQPNLSAKSVGDYTILLPSPETQVQISEQLLAADQKIQTERDYLVKLQNMKRGLMQDLLTNTVSVDTLL